MINKFICTFSDSLGKLHARIFYYDRSGKTVSGFYHRVISTNGQDVEYAFRGKDDWKDESFYEDARKAAETLNLLGYKNGNIDMPNPFSAEYRGICELYNMVMIKLLFVFIFLVILCIYVCIKVGVAYVLQWERVKEIFFTEYRFARSYELWPAIRREYIARRQNALKLEVGQQLNPWWGLLGRFSDLKNNSGISVVKEMFIGFLLAIRSVFTSTTFWVYYSKLEFIWTFLPCIVLLSISLPSFTLALSLDESHKPASWIKIVGNQWFWVYESSYTGDNLVIYSNVVYGTDLTDNALRAVEADCVVTLVNNKFNRILVTSADVIHCWAVPSLGIKVDACPGRINTVSVMPTKCGVYYGQCSEICGVNHGFMPIIVEVVV